MTPFSVPLHYGPCHFWFYCLSTTQYVGSRLGYARDREESHTPSILIQPTALIQLLCKCCMHKRLHYQGCWPLCTMYKYTTYSVILGVLACCLNCKPRSIKTRLVHCGGWWGPRSAFRFTPMTSPVDAIRRSITASSAPRAPCFAYIVSGTPECFGIYDMTTEDTRQSQCRGLCVYRRRPMYQSLPAARHGQGRIILYGSNIDRPGMI
ncbi:hypothetical protein LZ32DRAFT_294021 [Colletotrichum eremochloae]|nr:hypothetical protein LZ32DRAFT_294021 [Colletotrichum eremochloae]